MRAEFRKPFDLLAKTNAEIAALGAKKGEIAKTDIWLRQWAGVIDMTGDRSPIISKTGTSGSYLNCGWGTGGLKATPGSGRAFADAIAGDRPHPIAAPFRPNRFLGGRLMDESIAAAAAH